MEDEPRERGLFAYLERIERKQDRTMAAIDDLNNAVVALQGEAAAVEQAVTDLVAAVAASSAANDPAIATAVTNINTVTEGLKASAASDPGAPPAPA